MARRPSPEINHNRLQRSSPQSTCLRDILRAFRRRQGLQAVHSGAEEGHFAGFSVGLQFALNSAVQAACYAAVDAQAPLTTPAEVSALSKSVLQSQKK